MLAAITVVSLRTWEMAETNFDVYIGHLSSFIEETANSGYFWGFMILSVAFLFILNTESSNLSAGIILGYLNLVFFIFYLTKFKVYCSTFLASLKLRHRAIYNIPSWVGVPNI